MTDQKKSSTTQTNSASTQSSQVVCNYSDNYYGDCVCRVVNK